MPRPTPEPSNRWDCCSKSSKILKLFQLLSSHGDEARIFYISTLFDEIDWRDRSQKDNQKVISTSSVAVILLSSSHLSRFQDFESSRRNLSNSKIPQFCYSSVSRLRRGQQTADLPNSSCSSRRIWIGKCELGFITKHCGNCCICICLDAFAE